MKSGKVVISVLAGAAAGAVLGMLFAPEKGTRIRRQIANKSEDYVDEVKDTYEKVLDSVAQKVRSIKRNAKCMASQDLHNYKIDTING